MNRSPTTIASSSRIILKWAGLSVDIEDGILSFRSRQLANVEPVHPLNADPAGVVRYEGWAIQIAVERRNSALDQLFYQIELAYRNGGGTPYSVGTGVINVPPGPGLPATTTPVYAVAPGVLYHYIAEPDGSQTTAEYIGISGFLSDAGTYQISRPVVQVLDLTASARNLL